MKIIQITSAANMTYGAMHSMVNLVNGLQAAGDSVEFITFRGRKGGPLLRQMGHKVTEVPVRIKLDLLAAIRMARIIRAAKADIVHTHLSTSSINGAIAARLAKVPSVATVHGMSGKGSFAFADHLIAVSGAVKAHLISQQVPAEKISVVYNGVEDLNASPEDRLRARESWGAGPETFVVGTVARVTALKGIYEAIQAAAAVRDRLGDFKFVVIGDGDDLPRCRSLAERENMAKDVLFPGYLEPISQYVCGLDLLLFPSFKEAMGMAIVEAGLCRVPAAAFSAGGVPEVISERTGILVSTGDTAHLSEAILSLANDPCRRLEMGEAARAMALERFSLAAMTDETRKVYRTLTGD